MYLLFIHRHEQWTNWIISKWPIYIKYIFEHVQRFSFKRPNSLLHKKTESGAKACKTVFVCVLRLWKEWKQKKKKISKALSEWPISYDAIFLFCYRLQLRSTAQFSFSFSAHSHRKCHLETPLTVANLSIEVFRLNFIFEHDQMKLKATMFRYEQKKKMNWNCNMKHASNW